MSDIVGMIAVLIFACGAYLLATLMWKIWMEDGR